MKKMGKRFIAAAVSILTVLLQFSSVSAQVFEQGCVADVFDNFASYSLGGGANELPEGWKTPTNRAPVTGVVSAVDPETKSSVIKLPAGQSIVYPFSEVINTGKVYVSFDLKQSIGANPNHFGSHIAIGKIDANNINNYWHDRGSDMSEYAARWLLWYMNDANENKYMYRNPLFDYKNKTELGATDSGWHKYEWVIDLDGNEDTATFYLDGEVMYENVPLADDSYNRGIKDFYFSIGADNREAYLDNWCVKHYKGTESIAPKMAAEYDKNGIPKVDGGIELAFSERIDAFAIYASDMKILNQNGEDCTDKIAEVNLRDDASAVNIKFSDIPAGKYSVEWVNAELFRNGKPQNKAYFVVGSGVESGAAKYYINEDFEGYTGGIPNGFRTFGVDPNMLKTSMLSADGNSGKALEINSAGKQTARFAYDFKYPLRTGRYTVEFDVNADNSKGWIMRLLDEATVEYQNADGAYMFSDDYNSLYNAYKTEKGEAFTEDGWKAYIASDESKASRNDKFMASSLKSAVIGANSSGQIGYVDFKNNWIDAASDTYRLSEKQEGWTHIKVVLDFNSGKYEFQIGNGNVQVKDFNEKLWHRTAMVNKDTLNRTFVHGIGGISFENLANGITLFDNIKVFKDNSYVFYDDFNTLVGNNSFGASKGKSKPGWYIINENGDGVFGSQEVKGNPVGGGSTNNTNTKLASARMVAASGKSGEGTDKSAKFDLFSNEMIGCLFDAPIKGTNSFTVEFDVKTETGKGLSNVWKLGLMNEKDSQSRASNTLSSEKAAETGLAGNLDSSKSWNVAYDYHSNTPILVTHSIKGSSSPWYMNDEKIWLKDYHNTGGATVLENAYKNNEWNHIKLTVTPTTLNGKKAYKTDVIITNSAEGSFSATHTAAVADNAISGDNDIYGLSFQGSPSDWTEFSIDNLKVCENTQAVSAGLLEVGEIGFNGEYTKKDNGLSSTAKGLRAEFSVPLKSAEGIALKYSDNSSVAFTKSLSSDGKCVDIIFSEAPIAGKQLVLTVGKDAEFDFGSYLSEAMPVSKVISVVQGEENTVISDFRMFEMFDDIQVTENGATKRTVPGGLYPVTNEALNGKDLSKIYLVAKGYSTKPADEIFAAAGGYSSQGEEMKDILTQRSNVQRGEFEIKLNLGELNSSVKNIKGFVWNADDFAPLERALDYGYVAPGAAE